MRSCYKLLIILGISSVSFAGIQFHSLKDIPTELRSGVAERPERMLEGGRLDFSNLSLKSTRSSEFRFELPKSERMLEAYHPDLPTQTKVLKARPGYRLDVRLSDVVVEESDGPVPMKKVPAPKVWGGKDLDLAKTVDGYYPGRFYHVKNTGRLAYLQLFPVQYDERTGKTVVLKSANILTQEVADIQKPIIHNVLQTPSIILTSITLKESARKLQVFHWEKQKIRSDIYYVEDIDASVEPVDEQTLPDGYKNEAKEKDSIVEPYNAETKTGYNYQLSRKIIAFLRSQMGEGSKLQYVTVLGDSTLIPPSYYFYFQAQFSRAWGVTDHCYSSINNCLDSQVALGRLPFRTNEEVDAYLNKADRWLENRSIPKTELSLLGGKAFPNAELYEGEVGALRLIDSPRTDWVGTKKYFRTKFNYNKDLLLSLASGKLDTRLVYDVDHGEGNLWFVENEKLSSKEIRSAKAEMYPVTPIVVSIACTNAAFDEDLTKEFVFGDAKYGKPSIGKALLQAPGGAVSYLGAARRVVGNPVYRFDESGNLKVDGTNYGLRFLEIFFEKYRENKNGRMGDHLFAAQRLYVFESGVNMSEEANRWTYYMMTLLGDPTLPMPEREVFAENNPTAKSTYLFETAVVGMPELRLAGAQEISLSIEAPSAVSATLFQKLQFRQNFLGEKVLQVLPKVLGTGNLVQKFNPKEDSSVYFMRLENLDGVPRENQVWFHMIEK